MHFLVSELYDFYNLEEYGVPLLTIERITAKLIKELDVKSSLYHWCDMLDEVKPTSNEEIRYVYNLDKKEYVDLFKQPTQWCHYSNELGIGPVKINSFALLTGCGNGLGGGDYFFINHQSVGSWAGDRFVSSKEPLEEYKKFKCRDEIYNELKRLYSDFQGNRTFDIKSNIPLIYTDKYIVKQYLNL